MKILRENTSLIRDTALDNSSGYIDLKSLAARVHLKLPAAISSKCTRQDIADFIIKNCFAWGIAIQNGHRLIMHDAAPTQSSIGSILVECEGNEIKVVGGYAKIDSVLDTCGFATAYDLRSSSTMILVRNREGKLTKAEGSYWPAEQE